MRLASLEIIYLPRGLCPSTVNKGQLNLIKQLFVLQTVC